MRPPAAAPASRADLQGLQHLTSAHDPRAKEDRRPPSIGREAWPLLNQFDLNRLLIRWSNWCHAVSTDGRCYTDVYNQKFTYDASRPSEAPLRRFLRHLQATYSDIPSEHIIALRPGKATMLSTVLALYTTALTTGVTTPVPHFYGPPGSGKSSVIQQAADLLGVQLHVINVSRISPLELEGIQMPIEGKLELLLATYWNSLKEGDIVFLDEFLRGFPEVYNGLLDILSSRKIGAHTLPKVVFFAASNSTTSYDSALHDRLLHISVPDPRRSVAEFLAITTRIVEQTGLDPVVASGTAMRAVMDKHVLASYKMLDSLKRGTSVAQDPEALSARQIIGQLKLRYVTSDVINELVADSNAECIRTGHWQYFLVVSYKGRTPTVPASYEKAARDLLKGDKISPEQRVQTLLNFQLLGSFDLLKGEVA